MTVRVLLTREQRQYWVQERHLPRSRAESIAFRARVRDLVEPMEGAGGDGLSAAAQRYSPTEGASFATFARLCVDRAIFHFLRLEHRHRNLHLAGYVVAGWGGATLGGRTADEMRPAEDDEHAALVKLRGYLNPKAMAGAIALLLDAEPEREDEPEHEAMFQNLRASLREVLAGFNERDRRLLMAIHGEGKTVEATAVEIGLAYPTTKARHRKLLGRLREALTARGFEGTSR